MGLVEFPRPLYLENEGFRVFKFYSSEKALECINSQSIDLAVLDIMMPVIDGLKLCRKIREHHHYPIIMLTAKGTESGSLCPSWISAEPQNP